MNVFDEFNNTWKCRTRIHSFFLVSFFPISSRLWLSIILTSSSFLLPLKLSQVPLLKLCEEINDACAIIDKTLGWPGFLHCYSQQGKHHRFPSSCHNSITEIQFNTTSQCVAPLIAVSDPDSWYEETECGLQCQDPLFTKAELDRVSVFIFVLGWGHSRTDHSDLQH